MEHFKLDNFVLFISLSANVLCNPRKVTVHDPYLDIVILIDAKLKMNHIGFMWIDSYFAEQDGFKTSETRFAVMSCAHSQNGLIEVSLYLNENLNVADPAKKVNDVVRSVHVGKQKEKATWQKLNECVTTTLKKILVPERGERLNASDVVVYVSDCKKDDNVESHIDAMKNLFPKVAALLIMCTKESEDIVEWMKKDKHMLLFKYTNDLNVMKKFDEILPSKDIQVFDCKLKELTECKFGSDRKTCTKTVYQVIAIHPHPKYRSKLCDFVENRTESCQPNDCSTTKLTITETATKSSKFVKTTDQETDASVTGLIAGVVSGLLVLVLINTVMLFVLVRWCKSKATEANSASVKSKSIKEDVSVECKRSENERNVNANTPITESQRMKPKLGKASGKGKQSIVKGDKSAARSSTMSKNGSPSAAKPRMTSQSAKPSAMKGGTSSNISKLSTVQSNKSLKTKAV